VDKDMNNYNLKKCIESIEMGYWYDTLTLLDCVLTDDPVEPEYSANTVYSRLEEIVAFQNLYFKLKVSSVADLMQKNGYSNEDVELLMQRRIDEDKRHNQ